MVYRYPIWQFDGITCAFSNPERVKAVWAFESFKLLREFQVHLADLNLQTKNPATFKLTRRRLESMAQSVYAQILDLERLLEPLGLRQIAAAQVANYLNESPGPSRLAANYENIFRDWAWGEAENLAALNLIRSVAPSGHNWGRFAVFGAGACRLAYDLHLCSAPTHTVVSDINPLLFQVAQKLIRHGESVELVEFPVMPIHGDKSAILHRLEAPAKISTGLEFVLMDVTDPAFENQSFDTILTPWLIDVIKMDLRDFLPLLNRLLPVGGTWITFGPLGFNSSKIASHYSLEEVRYIVEKSGFEIRGEKYEMIPYMHNPSSNSHRHERVWCASATKTKDVELKDTLINALYPWESDKDSPIEIPVQQLNLANGHRFNAEVFAMIDGKTSFNAISQRISSQTQLPIEHASVLLTQVLLTAESVARKNPLRR